ncbi:unnamed protein product [Ectocarpus fasciculatus]
MSSSSIEVKLKRIDRVYHPNDKVEGTVVVNAFKGWSHQGIKMNIDGNVLTNSVNTGIGIIDNLASTARPHPIMREEILIAPPGTLPHGVSEIPFQFALTGSAGQSLLESYHGVFINVVYVIKVNCDRGVMKKDVAREIEFIIEVPMKKNMDQEPGDFEISPDVLENVGNLDPSSFPRFKIVGKVHRYNCPISQPFTGEILVEHSDAAIRSLELQLVRLETILGDGHSVVLREATEVQLIQIGDGDVCRNMAIPMYMVFPRLYSCPSLITNSFKIEFEINLIVSFINGFTVTENFPIRLYREA